MSAVVSRGDGLDVVDLAAHYGPVQVLAGVSVRVGRGEIVALLGPNGAGKTTLMSVIAGVVPATAGRIVFEGHPVTALAIEERVQRGIALVPEGRMLFAGMRTMENLELGAFALPARRRRTESRSGLERIFRLFPVLEQRRRQVAGSLSGGEQQMVAVGRGLMTQPRLLLLDEPSLGLSPLMVRGLMDALAKLTESGLSILLSEQNAAAALRIAHRGYVMGGGRVILEGSRDELRAADHIKTAYLGAP